MSEPAGLRWEKQRGESWYGYSGKLVVAMVGERDDGEGSCEWYYTITAVHTKWITKGHGEVKSERSAKSACDRAWADWLAHAGLVPAATGDAP